MERRSFIKSSALAVGALSASPSVYARASNEKENEFQLNYAPHLGMFKNVAGEDPIDQLEFMADQGFRAFEDNDMKKRAVDLQEKMASTMAKRNIKMGVFVAHTIYWDKPNLASGDESLRAKFLKEIKDSIEVAKRVQATWMTVVPGHLDLRKDMGYQTAHVIESLKQAAGLLEPHGLVMVLEPLNFINHPGLFLTKSDQAYAICKGVNSPSCKILFDIYHQQITEGNLIRNIDNSYDEIAYFQIGDNPGRNEPTTGEINYRNIFKHISEKGYSGILGMEHGNSIQGSDGDKAVISAYRTVDNF